MTVVRLLGSARSEEPDRGFVRSCWKVLVAGFCIRLLFAPFTSISADVGVWATAALHGMDGVRLYAQPGFSYPPVWGYLLHAGGLLARLAGIAPSAIAKSPPGWAVLALRDGQLSHLITTPLATLAIKAPLIVSDLIVAWLVWHLSLSVGMSNKLAKTAVCLWVLCPLVVFVTAVHGAFDTLVALALCAALLARLRRKYFWAGAAVAFGVLTKLTPVFVVPLLLASCLWPLGDEQGNERWAAVGRMMAGGAVATCVLLAPLAIHGSFGDALASVFTRSSAPSSIGGLSWLGFSDLPAFSSVSAWALEPGNPVISASVLADVAISLGTAAWWARSRRRDGVRLLAASAAAMAGVLVAGPLTNPQYFLWVLPMLVVLGARHRWLAGAAALLTVSGILFEIAVQAPFGFLSPASVAFGVPSIQAIAADRLAMRSHPFIGVPVGPLLMFCAFVLTLVGLVAMGVGLRAVWRCPGARDRGPVTSASGLRALSAVMLAAPAGLGVLSVVVVPSSPMLFTMSASARPPGKIEVSWQGAAGPVAALLTPTPQPLDRVVVYADPSYPTSGSSHFAVQGVVDHLPVDLAADDLRARVEVVGAVGLSKVLTDRARSDGTVVVDAAGTLPDTVWAHGLDEVTPFLESGGTLAWGGDEPGYYSVGPAPAMTVSPPPQGVPDYRCGPVPAVPGPPRDSAVTALGMRGVSRLLGHHGLLPPSWGWGCIATRRSGVASALRLSSAAVHGGPRLSSLAEMDGDAIGYSVRGRTSIAWIPRGHGGVLLFSGGVDATAFSSDLATLLATSGAHPDPVVVSVVRDRPDPPTRGAGLLAVPSRACRAEVALVSSAPWSTTVREHHLEVQLCTTEKQPS